MSGDSIQKFLSEVLRAANSRSKKPENVRSNNRRGERTNGERKFKNSLEGNIPEYANVPPGRFGLSIKSFEDGFERFIA